jgi:hypothetical protein
MFAVWFAASVATDPDATLKMLRPLEPVEKAWVFIVTYCTFTSVTSNSRE